MKYVLLQRQRPFLEPGLAWRTLLAQLCQLSSSEVTHFSFTSQFVFFSYCSLRINETIRKAEVLEHVTSTKWGNSNKLLISWVTSVSSTKPGLQETHTEQGKLISLLPTTSGTEHSLRVHGQGRLLPLTRIIYCNSVKNFLKTVKARAHSPLGWF